jgi:hypothetical protein
VGFPLLALFFILIVTAVSLTVILWAGTFFFQGYIYTEPSPGIVWQAPAAAALLTLGYTVWCLCIALNPNASPRNLPIDTILNFNPEVEMSDLKGKPAENVWAILRHPDPKKAPDDKEFEKIPYACKRDTQTRFHYVSMTFARHRWQDSDRLIAIEIEKPDKTKMRFNRSLNEAGQFRSFVSQDGWTLTEIPGDGPIKGPSKFSFTMMFLNLFFNFAHFVGWFVGLWLLLRFQWVHALGIAVLLWLTFTLLFLPMMLGYAGLVAANRQATTALLWGFVAVC